MNRHSRLREREVLWSESPFSVETEVLGRREKLSSEDILEKYVP